MKKVLVTMIFLAVAFSTNTFAQSIAEKEYRQGESLFNQGKAEEAFKLLKSSAGRGYGPAMNAIGYCYQYGKGVSRNNTYALQWYMNAYVQGDLEGAYNYGWMHLRGDCKRDKTLAKKYLTMAANGGHAKAKEILREEGWLEIEKKQPKYVPQKKEPVSTPKKSESTTSYTYEEDTRKDDTYTHSRQRTTDPIGSSWYTGTWNSTINNLIDHPKTVCLRIEVVDKETRLPISNVQISFEGNYWIAPKTSRDEGGERNDRKIEYKTSCRTDSKGMAVASFTWNKEYPWSFGTDEVEKAQGMTVKHSQYKYREFPTPFSGFLEVGQKKTKPYPIHDDTFQELHILKAFEKALEAVYSQSYTEFVVLDLGTKYNYFDQNNSTRLEFFEKVYSKNWGEVFGGPRNLFKTGTGGGRSWCGPYLIYDIEIQLERTNRRRKF